MPRIVTDEFLLRLHQRTDDELGTQLAKLCVKANIPISYVAEAVGVSRVTAHSWFHGARPVGLRSKAKVKQFMKAVEQGLDQEKLPAKDFYSAKLFSRRFIEMDDA